MMNERAAWRRATAPLAAWRRATAPPAAWLRPTAPPAATRLALLAGVTLSLAWMVREYDATLVLPLLLVGCAAAPLLLRPDLATLAVLFLVYSNLPGAVARAYGLPSAAAIGMTAFLVVPVALRILARRETLTIDPGFRLLLAFLGVLVLSALFAREPGIAAARIGSFVVEGVILYWLVVNLIRTESMLRRAVWTVVAAGALLGGLSAVQAVTGAWHQEFAGLAQRKTHVVLESSPDGDPEPVVRLVASERAAGPFGEPNRYAQILIVLLPLAIALRRHGSARPERLAAAAAAVLVLAGVLLSFSRGALLSLALLTPAAMAVRWLRLRHVAALVLCTIVVAGWIAPGLGKRVTSITGVAALVSDRPDARADGAIRGRATEMLAAAWVFLDHPILGVGPGQYMPVYSAEYQQSIPVRFRDRHEPRRAHNLILELGAETGSVGLICFSLIIAALLVRLHRARRAWLPARPDRAELALAFAFAITAYLVTGLFLHLAFERYLWLLLALAAASVHTPLATVPAARRRNLTVTLPPIRPRLAAAGGALRSTLRYAAAFRARETAAARIDSLHDHARRFHQTLRTRTVALIAGFARLRTDLRTHIAALSVEAARLHSSLLANMRSNLRSRTASAAAPRAPSTAAPSAASTAAPPAPRLAYIMSRFPKLTETFVLNEILALERLGARVDLYPLLRQRQTVQHPEALRLTRQARFLPFISPRIIHAQFHFLRRDPRRYLGVWRDVLRETWGSPNFFIGAIGILPKAVRFACEMRAAGITHVHAHFANHPAVAAFVIHRLTGIPYSFTAHGSDLHVERRMLGLKVREASFVVTISDYNRDLIVRECGEAVRGKVRVIHCGIDPSTFRPAAVDAEDGAVRIVCVASFEEVKGHAHLVDACRILFERGIDFRCDLVGDGPLRANIRRRILRAGLQSWVRICGGLPRAGVVDILRRSHIAVLASCPTSAGKREGIPVALMEAMACGLPVVASRISGIPELVEHEHSGLLVPPADPVRLADALETLARDPSLRLRLGRHGRTQVIRNFDLHTNAGALLALITSSGNPTPRDARPVHHE